VLPEGFEPTVSADERPKTYAKYHHYHHKITIILINSKNSKDIKHENLKQLKIQWVGTQT